MKFLRIFLLFSFAVLFPASECPAPHITTFNGLRWVNEGKIVEIEVSDVEVGSLLRIETSSDLASGKWVPANAAEQTVETLPARMAFFVSNEAEKGFFRVVVKAPTVSVRDGVLVVSEETTLDQVLNALNRSGDQQYSIQNPYEGEDIQDPANPSRVLIAAGEYQFANAEDLNRQIFDPADKIKRGIWAAPPAKDDRGIADRDFPATTVSQLAVDQPHDIPGDTTTDDFSKGWGGDEIRIVPGRGQPIPPGQFDMPFENLDTPGNKLEQIELPPNNNIGYVRVEWEFVRDPNVAGLGNLIAANIQPKQVYEVRGDTGFLSAYPPIPGKDHYIAAIVGANGDILQITTFIDPLVDRSYPPDLAVAHHRNTAADSGEAVTTVPLVNGSVTQDLAGLAVHLYGVKQQFDGDENILSPDVLTGNPDTFVRLAATAGKQLTGLLAQQPSRDDLLQILQDQIGDPPQRRQLGDVNCDGVLNVLDITLLVQVILNGNVPCCPAAADINRDGAINVLDQQALVAAVQGGDELPFIEGCGQIIVDPDGGGIIVDPGGGIVDPGFGGLGRAQAKALGISAVPSVTEMHRSGSNGSKLNITIIGDGFDASDADQQLFDDYVDNVLMDGFLNEDIHPEILNGINVVKINTFSTDSGVTQVNSSGIVTTTRRTALDTEYSGDWDRCWMEDGFGFFGAFNVIKLVYAPQTDISIIVMNETGRGACARGGKRFYITLGEPWSTAAHEFGHAPGGLGDEYDQGGGNYTGLEPGSPNLTTNTNRGTLKWRQWVPSWRSLPTTAAQVSHNTEDVGLFAGGIQSLTSYTGGIFHPSNQGTMNNNWPDHNPVGYCFMKNRMRPYQEATLRKNVTGDFNGDGRTDLVLLDGRQISLYLAKDRNVGADDPQRGSPPRSVTAVLDPTWYHTNRIPNSSGGGFKTRPSDDYYVGDFDGDGLDDIYVVNLTNWTHEWVVMLKSYGDHFEPINGYDDDLPGWKMRSGDQFYVADFNGDGRDDLCVYNGTNWGIPYFGMLRSTGTALRSARRYDRWMGNWEMGKKEKFYVGDYNGDGREDFVACDRNHWSQVHLRVFNSTGSALSERHRFYGTIEAGAIRWPMRRRDQIHALDFNGDGITDIATFNGRDWSHVYLGLWRVDNSGKMAGVRLYDTDGATAATDVIGWQMARRDKFYVADVNGDGNHDLVAYNKDNWSTQYLGMLRSNGGNRLQGSWQDDWIGSWNLGDSDSFKVADFRGSGGWDDLIVYNKGWLGLLRSYNNRFVQETLYRKWIHSHRYHKWGWW
ncbi:MAG: hypothetical protein GY899_04430 [Verrucomicrobiaceae bacterium]|nr:hypothetical protein [Verrucomicrobiaceae bacterium]